VVSAVHDDPNLLEISREYHHAAAVTTDDVTQIEGPGGRFDVIDPANDMWGCVLAAIGAATYILTGAVSAPG
jgi:hypothetical protein